MSESGCLRNESVESLNVTGIISGARRPVKLLVDKAAASAHDAITAAESGTIFLVPALGTAGAQTISLPACANSIGCYYTFISIATVGKDLDVITPASELILAVTADGAGNNSGISAGKNSIGFDENALFGASFTVTCISATPGIAWLAHDVIDSLEANVGGINLK